MQLIFMALTVGVVGCSGLRTPGLSSVFGQVFRHLQPAKETATEF